MFGERGATSREDRWSGRAHGFGCEVGPVQEKVEIALMLHCEARRAARRTGNGEYVPISEQDTQAWNRRQLEEADGLLTIAAARGRPARFQLEAAVQSAHAQRARSGSVSWPAIALLYEGLVQVAPTYGALIGRAAAVAQVSGPAAALGLLDAISDSAVQAYQPYWAARAHFLTGLGRRDEARLAYERASQLTEDVAVRRFLSSAQSELGDTSA
ncbi:MAG TPA: DUF6596 domain-containing protein [Polyangiaceae bacterium]